MFNLFNTMSSWCGPVQPSTHCWQGDYLCLQYLPWRLSSLCLCTECCYSGIRDSCENQHWNKKDKCTNAYDASVIHHLWFLIVWGNKKHGSNCMAGSTVSSTQSASLEDHKREEQYISVRTHVLFPSTIWVLEIWKARWDKKPFLTSIRTSQS